MRQSIQFRENGLAFTRLPIRFTSQSDNAELAEFIFNLFGEGFWVVIFGSSPHLTEELIVGALEYYNSIHEASRFPDGFYPNFEVVTQMPSDGDVLEVKDLISLNYFLSAGDSDSNISIFSRNYHPEYVVQFIEEYYSAREFSYDKHDQYLFFEEFIKKKQNNEFISDLMLLDTSYSDEDYRDYLLVSTDKIVSSSDIYNALGENAWPVKLACIVNNSLESA